MGKVIKLKDKPNDGVIPLLQELLGRAMAGKITDIAIVCLYKDNRIGTYFPSTENFYKLLGGVHQLAFDMSLEKNVDCNE